MITPEQIRAARALLRMEQKDLARRADVSVATVRRLEAEDGIRHVTNMSVEQIRRALEEAGAEFIPNGVRRQPKRDPHEVDNLFRDIMAIAERSAGRPVTNPDFGEADLYDNNGLPA